MLPMISLIVCGMVPALQKHHGEATRTAAGMCHVPSDVEECVRLVWDIQLEGLSPRKAGEQQLIEAKVQL